MIYGNLNEETTKKEEDKKVNKESTEQILEDCINIINSIGTQEISDEEVEKGIYDMRHEDFNKLIQSCGLSQLIIENLGTTEPTTEEVYALLDELGITVSSDNPYHVAVPVILNEAGTESDIEALLESAKSEANKYLSSIKVQYEHMLKYRFQNNERQGASWADTIRREQLYRVDKLGISNRGVYNRIMAGLDDAYDEARSEAAAETKMSIDKFPKDIPPLWDDINNLNDDDEFLRTFLIRYANKNSSSTMDYLEKSYGDKEDWDERWEDERFYDL
jgi:hypothetical protein